MPLGRQQGFSGAAVVTQLTETLNDSDLVMNVASVAGWPASGLPFTVTIDQGSDTLQETVVVDSYVGTEVTLDSDVGRGYDGTTAQEHAVNAPVMHTPDAEWFADTSARLFAVAQQGDIPYVSETDGVVMAALSVPDTDYEVVGLGTDGVPAYQQSAKSVLTTIGDLLFASGAHVLARLGIGTTGQVLSVDEEGVPAWTDAASLPVTTEGDLIVGTGEETATRLGVGPANSVLVGGDSPSYADGTDGQIMTIVDSVAEFADPPAVSGVLAATLLSDASSTMLPTSLEALNSGVFCTPDFVVPASGNVVVIISGGFLEFIDDSALYYAYLGLFLGGTDTQVGVTMMAGGGGYDPEADALTAPPVNLTFVVTAGLTPGDTVSLDIAGYASESTAIQWSTANPASVPSTPISVVVLAA